MHQLAHAILLLLLLLRFILVVPEERCRGSYCTQMYQQGMIHEAVEVGSNAAYCKVLSEYEECLKKTTQQCRDDLMFRTNSFFVTQETQQYCRGKLPAASTPSTSASTLSPQISTFLPPLQTEPPRAFNTGHTCHPLSPLTDPTQTRYCALFGDLHLRKLDGNFHTCSTEGAFALLDTNFFLIQITAGRVRVNEPSTAVTKAASEDPNLPHAFTDGSRRWPQHHHHHHSSTHKHHSVIEVVNRTDRHVELHLRHAGTVIVIRRQSVYLSVAVRLPHHVAMSNSEVDEQWCREGCRSGSRLPLGQALARPQAFAKCYGKTVHVPRKLAIERCKSMVDAFFDACVFDMMLTGNENLVMLAEEAQNDIQRLFPPHKWHYTTNRSSLDIYDNLAGQEWTNCIAISQPDSSFNLRVPLLLFLLLLPQLL